MKKLFAFVALLIAGFTLVACAQDSNFTVDVFIYDYSDTYIGSVRSALAEELKGMENITYNFHDAAASQETQSTQIDAAITAGSDLLVVNIVETASADNVVNKAKNANIPLIFFNREVEDTAVQAYDKAAFVGTDPDEAGYLQGELAADIILAEGAFEKLDRNGDGKIGYIMLRADLDNPEANGRTKYSIEEANRLLALADKPALEIVGTELMASWSTARAKELFDAVVANAEQFDQVDFVFANNDDMAIGAIQSLNTAGFNTKGGDKYIPVLGVDATAVAQSFIKDGQMSGSILQDGVAMAKCLAAFINNTALGNSYTANTDYVYEEGVNKVRIPYAKYIG